MSELGQSLNFNEQQLQAGFEAGYDDAVPYMRMLGCTGAALARFQKTIKGNGWIVAQNNEEAGKDKYTVLREQTGHHRSGILIDRTTHYKFLLEAAIEPYAAVPEPVVDALVIRQQVMQTVCFFFPLNFGGVLPRAQHDSMAMFYGNALVELPEERRGYDIDQDLLTHFARRFAQGFALLPLLKSLEGTLIDGETGRVLGPDMARGALANAIERARIHQDPQVRIMGDPVMPDVLEQVITTHSQEYNDNPRR